jgi:hypothetical protein
VEKLTSKVEASSTSLTSTQIPTIAEVMRMVKECGVKEKTGFMHTATLAIVKPETIIIVCMTLHNFIRDSELRDE